jgi:hypothetical protein
LIVDPEDSFNDLQRSCLRLCCGPRRQRRRRCCAALLVYTLLRCLFCFLAPGARLECPCRPGFCRIVPVAGWMPAAFPLRTSSPLFLCSRARPAADSSRRIVLCVLFDCRFLSLAVPRRRHVTQKLTGCRRPALLQLLNWSSSWASSPALLPIADKLSERPPEVRHAAGITAFTIYLT